MTFYPPPSKEKEKGEEEKRESKCLGGKGGNTIILSADVDNQLDLSNWVDI